MANGTLYFAAPGTTKSDTRTGQKPSPAGMTAAMLAALATGSSATSGISEQKRLLMELEKKVEEQKKLIEMQKVFDLKSFHPDEILPVHEICTINQIYN